MATQKAFVAKIYAQDGTTFLGSIGSQRPVDGSTTIYLKSIPTFRDRINNGQGEMVLDCGCKMDNFQEGSLINFSNIVELWCMDAANPLGRRIYKGYVSMYAPYLQANGDEGVKVTCMGLGTLFAKTYYGVHDTDFLSGFGSSGSPVPTDPTTIAQNALGQFNSEACGGSLITWNPSNALVGTTIGYFSFDQQSYNDVFNTCLSLTGTTWWWTVDKDGYFNFAALPSSPTHSFTIGKDVASLEAPKSAEELVNEVIYVDGSDTVHSYDDTGSQSTYGFGSTPKIIYPKFISGDDVSDATSISQVADQILAGSSSQLKASLVINPSYDLESIQVGQTCRILNWNANSTFWGTNNLQIVGLEYRGDSVQLDLSLPSKDFGLILQQLVSNG